MQPSAIIPLLLTLLLPACSSQAPAPETGPKPTPENVPTGGATVSVDNRSAFNMDVYVRRRDGPVRLGFAPSKTTTRFTLAPGLIAGSGIVQFSARPTRGGGGESVSSEPFTVQPGEDLSWVIPQ